MGMSRTRSLLGAVAAVSLVSAAVALPAVAGTHPAAQASRYTMGADVEAINPTRAMIDAEFYLGGYGLGSGKAAGQVQVIDGRAATGVLKDPAFPNGLADGVHVRSVVIGDGKHAIALAQIETQGYYAAYKQGPFGITEIRKHAAAQIAALHGSAIDAGAIVVDSNHSHSGPDTAGVWGGVPTSYLKLVHDQTVKAIVEAWRQMRPSVLSYGVAHAGVNGEAQYPPTDHSDWLLTNDFDTDPANQVMDDEVRVLQARDPDTGEVVGTYSNFSAHPTVLGSDNRLVTSDYPGRLSLMIAKTFGGFGFDQVATLGRTHSTHGGCDTASFPGEADSLCQLDTFSKRVMVKVQEALAVAKPFTGKPVVAMNSYLLNDPTTSAVLAGIVYAGQVIGAPAGRAPNAPWYTGNILGTSVFSGRIGNVLVNGGPGEMYPQIVQKVRDLVLADNPDGIKGVMNIGTAGDFLGYIIAPLEAYPEPAFQSVASHETDCNGVPDPAGVCPDP